MIVLLKNKAPYILSCALLSSAALLSVGCSSGDNDATEQSSSLTEKASSVVSSAQTVMTETVEKTADLASDAKDVVVDTAEKTADLASDAKGVVVDTAEKTADLASDAKSAVVETAEKATDLASNAKSAVVEKTEMATQTVAAKKDVAHDHSHEDSSVDGAKVYASCAGCHGSKAEGGVGPALNSQTSSEVAEKLTRYKAGEQIGPMTGMMTPIAKGLSDAEIKAVSDYVVTLK